MYVEVTPKSKIDKVYNSAMYKDFLKKSENKTLKNYNEFDI